MGPEVAETPQGRVILQNFPTDMRSVTKAFNIGPQVTVYAACPGCGKTYRPKEKAGVLEYQSRCDYRKFDGSKKCGARLTTYGMRGSKSIRVPRKPYAVQSFDAFVGRMLSRQGMETALGRASASPKTELHDVMDGETVSQIIGHDGKPFINTETGELRLAWALSVDWFNPYFNKAAGKSASTGSVAMVCLNLPPSLRFLPENIYLASVIPGAKEPSVDEINHYLKPVVDQLRTSYTEGTHYTSTYDSPTGPGRTCRSVIAALVCDLPGARKVAGLAGHSSDKNFCPLCPLKKSAINNIDWRNWGERKLEDVRKNADRHRFAKDRSARIQIFKEHGVRWSELYQLPYWNPLKMVVIDGMHCLFLGIVRHHGLHIIGLNSTLKESEKKSVSTVTTAEDRHETMHLLLEATDVDSACRAKPSILTLKNLCTEYGLTPEGEGGGKPSRRHYVAAIMVN